MASEEDDDPQPKQLRSMTTVTSLTEFSDNEREALKAWIELDRLGFLRWLTHIAQTYSLLVVFGMVFSIAVGLELTWFLDLASKMAHGARAQDMDYVDALWTTTEAVLLPVLLIMASLLIYSIVKLVRGQFLSVAFARARAVMLVAGLTIENNDNTSGGRIIMKTSPTLARRIDIWFSHWVFWSFCVLHGIVGILLAWKGGFKATTTATCLYAGFTFGGAAWAALTILWHTIAVCLIAKRTANMGLATAGDRHPVDVLQACFLRHHIDSWSERLVEVLGIMDHWLRELITDSSKYHYFKTQMDGIIWRMLISCANKCMKVMGKLSSSAQPLLEHERASTSRRRKDASLFFTIITIIWLISLPWVPTVFREGIWFVSSLCLSALIAIVLMDRFQEAIYHTFKKPGFVLFVCATIILAMVVLYTGFDNRDPIFAINPQPLPRSNASGKWVFAAKDAVTPYPVCLMRWGANSELSAIDLAILSSYSYDDNTKSYEIHGDAYTNTSQTFNEGDTTAEIIAYQPYRKVGRVIATRFVNNASGRNTTVLTVKGSSHPFDFYMDMKMWAMVAVFQSMVPFLDLLDLLPNWIFATILGVWGRPASFDGVDDMYRQITSTSNDEIILTGHSLGGGVVIAAGGHLSVPAVAFSGPGSHFMRYRFGTTMERTYRSAVNVKPSGDLIHMFDRHDEMGQRISCSASFAKCHSILSTICELWRVCGYNKPRNFSKMCENVFDDDPPRGTYLTEGHFGN